MKSFPWTSTADGLDDDGFPNYDRASTAEDLQEIYSKFFTNGVYADPGDTFTVVAGSGMGVNVKPGGCLINGTFGIELEERPLVIQASDPSNPRKDTVVLRWNKNVEARSIDLYVVQGTPAADPQRPALTRNSSVYELGIADVLIPAGASSVQQQYIADTRPDGSRCGYVSPLLDFDTTGLYEQIQAQVDENLELIQAALDGTLAEQLTNRVETLESEVQPIERGGTGATSVAAARNALGLGNTTGALPIENGGTGATTAAAARNALGLGNTTGALPIENGGTGQSTLETAVSQMCGIGFGASKKITDCMNIDLSNPYSATNLPCVIGTENASTLASCPVTSGAFYAQRTVYPIKADDGRYHFIVYLHEMWPEPWRVWAASYNKDSQKWDGWHQISTRMESKPQFANDMMVRSLGSAIILDNGTDLNNVKTPGTYCVTEHVNAQTIGNAPTKYSFKLIVEYNAGNSFYTKQTFTDLYFNTYVRKTGDGGQWENWVQTSAAYAALDGAMPVPYSQMGNAVAMLVQTADLTDDQAMAVSTLYPEWQTDVEYNARQIVRDGGHLFRCAQRHTSSEQNKTSVASLWTQIDKAGDGVDVWQQPTGAHDAYNKGDRVHYPDADGPIYVSQIDGNTWSPDAYPDGWKLEG